jgi:hypothetical protein
MTENPAAESRPQGTIQVTVQGGALTVGLVPPTVLVNGHRLSSAFGTMDVPVWAGRNRVDAHAQWMRRYGEASLEFDVAPGQTVPVFYAAPWHQFTHGSMGFEKQKRRGRGALLGIFAFSVAIVGLLVGLLAAAG